MYRYRDMVIGGGNSCINVLKLVCYKNLQLFNKYLVPTKKSMCKMQIYCIYYVEQ